MELKENFKTKVLLVDDQKIIADAIQKMLAGQSDILFHYCNDPSKAIQLAQEISPTVILQDLVMPDIDGLVLVKYFRANPLTKDVPLVVLSTKEDPQIKAEAFAFGANDYMVKLPDSVELIARLRYHSNAYIRLLERNEAYEKLAENQKVLDSELLEAATYVTSLLPPPISTKSVEHPISTNWKFIPSTKLGGDAFGYHWLDESHFCLYLLDVCGHGVGAAVFSVTIMNVLRSQSLPNTNFYDPSAVLESLNETFPMESHNNMFFTIWYGVFNSRTHEIIFSSGGHPPAILFTGEEVSKATVKELKTEGLVIGAVPGSHYVSDICVVGKYGKLYLFSDGIYEISQPDGSVLPREDFVKLLVDQGMNEEQSLDDVLKEVSKLNHNEPFLDDVSIIEVIF